MARLTAPLPAREAVAVFCAALALWFVAGAALPPTAAGVALAQVLFFAGPPVVWTAARGARLRDGLGLRAPRPAAVAGAVLVGASFWLVNLAVSVPILDRLGADSERLREVERALPWADAPAATRVVAVALVPAVCEELLVRGAVARALRPAIGAAAAVGSTAALFAALHWPPERMVPAALFGAVLGAIALAADSAIPAIAAHLCNNLVALWVLPAWPGVAAALDAHPAAALAVAAALSVAGAMLSWRSRIRRES
ncbi:MAG: CPBP family intramembrane metalloprotease [Deltaproteobacteria bacterium]|nr:MAG: CPBP family intramembrane metalloprotease [Deltaproteobacteria bacterium]